MDVCDFITDHPFIARTLVVYAHSTQSSIGRAPRLLHLERDFCRLLISNHDRSRSVHAILVFVGGITIQASLLLARDQRRGDGIRCFSFRAQGLLIAKGLVGWVTWNSKRKHDCVLITRLTERRDVVGDIVCTLERRICDEKYDVGYAVNA